MAWHSITSLDELVEYRYHRPSIELNAQEDRSDQSWTPRADANHETPRSRQVRSVSCNPGRIMHHALRFSIPEPEKVTAKVAAVYR